MRAVIAAVVIAGSLAACKSGPTCLLEDVITDRVGAQELHDCGTAEVVGQMMTPQADAMAIHDCVIADQASQTPFRAEIRAESETGTVAAAFIGLTEGGVWKTYVFGFTEEDDARTNTASCTAISEQAPCDDMYLYSNLCLICDGQQATATCPAPE